MCHRTVMDVGPMRGTSDTHARTVKLVTWRSIYRMSPAISQKIYVRIMFRVAVAVELYSQVGTSMISLSWDADRHFEFERKCEYRRSLPLAILYWRSQLIFKTVRFANSLKEHTIIGVNGVLRWRSRCEIQISNGGIVCAESSSAFEKSWS